MRNRFLNVLSRCALVKERPNEVSPHILRKPGMRCVYISIKAALNLFAGIDIFGIDSLQIICYVRVLRGHFMDLEV